MSVLLIAVLSGICFIIAYNTYGRWLGGRITLAVPGAPMTLLLLGAPSPPPPRVRLAMPIPGTPPCPGGTKRSASLGGGEARVSAR